MPQVRCPHCRRVQIVRRELEGLEVDCERCKKPFTADASGDAPSYRDMPSSVHTAAKSVGLLAGLILTVGTVFFVSILLIRSKDTTPPTATTTARTRPTPAVVPGQTSQPEKDQTEEDAKSAAGGLLGLAILAAGFLYVLLALYLGAFVAFDAYARNLNGLGWATFYYGCHVLGRLILYAMATLPMVLIGPLFGALPSSVLFFVAVLVGEPVSWLGLFVYFYARRPGSLKPCPNCKVKRLSYMLVCPHCQAKSLPAGVKS